MTKEKHELDPFDVAQFRAPNTLDGSGDGIRKEFTHIRVGKPKKSSFFRSHPGSAYRLPVYIIEDDSEMIKQEYLVIGSAVESLVEETKPKLLVLCVDKMGTLFLWLAPRLVEDGFQRPNLWNSSALEALARSETTWVRMSANKHEGAYTRHTSSSDEEPIWPDIKMSELIRLGFGEKHVIRDTDHPLITRLWGRD